MKILVATTNKGKVKEFQDIFNSKFFFEIVTLNDLKISSDVEETGSTFERNAEIKAKYYNKISSLPTISEDSGLVIESLNGEPGVYSARYGGASLNDDERLDLVLRKMHKIPKNKRSAKFVSVICGVGFMKNKLFFSRGELRGYISFERKGKNGFGYDPIFCANKDNHTLASKTTEYKNSISHRRKSIEIFLSKLIKDKII
ncbi:MAG: RdgB/HAM1 family non-canonical purine NTP pyrophosphatase [Dehalococcoidia bacterium]|nr:RdgB/HAM1 family non-canonical purine NTP pyrophosphatase [Dehalococcoidia bacterium]|tara:strand:+ start:49 stop:651 length:603 start_codon:yes stop_codon:yes gene_type:complete